MFPDPCKETKFLGFYFWEKPVSPILYNWSEVKFPSADCRRRLPKNNLRPSSASLLRGILIACADRNEISGCCCMNLSIQPFLSSPANRNTPYTIQYISSPFRSIAWQSTGNPWCCIPLIQPAKSASISAPSFFLEQAWEHFPRVLTFSVIHTIYERESQTRKIQQQPFHIHKSSSKLLQAVHYNISYSYSTPCWREQYSAVFCKPANKMLPLGFSGIFVGFREIMSNKLILYAMVLTR